MLGNSNDSGAATMSSIFSDHAEDQSPKRFDPLLYSTTTRARQRAGGPDANFFRNQGDNPSSDDGRHVQADAVTQSKFVMCYKSERNNVQWTCGECRMRFCIPCAVEEGIGMIGHCYPCRWRVAKLLKRRSYRADSKDLFEPMPDPNEGKPTEDQARQNDWTRSKGWGKGVG